MSRRRVYIGWGFDWKVFDEHWQTVEDMKTFLTHEFDDFGFRPILRKKPCSV